MQIKITRDIPVQEQFKPEINKIYDVVRFKWVNSCTRLFFIMVNETEVGIYEKTECEIIKEATK